MACIARYSYLIMSMSVKIMTRKIAKRWNGGVVRLEPLAKRRGRALLSYITAPFVMNGPLPNSHSNYWECTEIARLLQMRGFAVDVIDWDNTTFIPHWEYDIAIDIHTNLARLEPHFGPRCKKIFHVTGSCWQFQNDAEKERLTAIKARRGVSIPPRRQLSPTTSIECADFMSGLGNEITFRTYGSKARTIMPIPLSTTVMFSSPKDRDFIANRRRFIWLGGGGAVLKGLDLVLEAFAAMPEFELTVCGPIDAEPEFTEAYRKELYETPNIRTIGRVDVGSDEFKRLANSSLALVYPSASEGQSGSVVTALHAGLIPIVSGRTGVDLDGFGTVIDTPTPIAIMAAIREISELPDSTLRDHSIAAWRYARLRHTRWMFFKSYDAFLSRALSESESLVSVIIPAHESETTIEAAVRSILAQTHRNIEIVVVDDASTDRTKEVVARLAEEDGRITYRRLDVDDPRRFNKDGRNINAGYSARNAGLAKANGLWITFQDADDASFPERIATQLALARFHGAGHLTVDWMPYADSLVGRHFDIDGFLAFEEVPVIDKDELKKLARRTKGIAFSLLGPLHQFIPFSVKTARIVNKLFFRSLEPYPGSGNSPLFEREYLTRLSFRRLTERVWPSFVGRGADRDFNFQASETFSKSVVVGIPLYLWRVRGGVPRADGNRYIV